MSANLDKPCWEQTAILATCTSPSRENKKGPKPLSQPWTAPAHLQESNQLAPPDLSGKNDLVRNSLLVLEEECDVTV